MSKCKNHIITFLILIGLSYTSNAQINKFQALLFQIDKDLETHAEKFPEERIFLLTDKEEYLAGEIIFISCFLNINGQPSNLSRTLYIETGNEFGKIIDKKMLRVEKGMTLTSFQIPVSFTSGNYTLNAYTLWMKNNLGTIAQKPVVVINKDYLSNPFRFKSISNKASQILIEPESHVWLENVPNNFSVQLLNDKKNPVISEFLILENNKQIFTSKTDSNGLAKIQFSPKKNQLYSIKAQEKVFPISFPSNEGLLLKFNNENKTRLLVTLEKSAAIASNKFLLIAIDKEKICFQAEFDINEGATAASILKTKLPNGVLNFLLFDEELNIVAHHRFYNYKTQNSPLTEAPTANENILYQIDTSINNGVLNVTVLPNQSILNNHTVNYISFIPEIQNQYNIFIPDFSLKSQESIDALLELLPSEYIGKKWHLNDQKLLYGVESGISLKGTVKPYASNSGSSGYQAELVIKGDDSTTTYSVANALPNGEFGITDLSFNKEARIFFQGNNPKNKKEIVKIQLKPSYLDTLNHLSLKPVFQYEKEYVNSLTTDQQKKLEIFNADPKFKELLEVVIKVKKKSALDSLKQEYLSPLFDDGNASVLTPQGNYFSIWQFLRGAVPGLKIEGSLDNPTVYISRYNVNGASNSSGEDVSAMWGDSKGVLFFLNEIEVSKDVISSVNMEDVALVSINREPMPLLGAYNGLIAIFTKKGVALGNSTSKSMAFEKRKGYSPANKVFHLSPDQYKPGQLIHQQLLNGKTIQLQMPKNHLYKVMSAGWNKQNEFVIF
ncbi:MAG: hypothetical protein WKF85_05165 [Chitinophagaceae bacterium]